MLFGDGDATSPLPAYDVHLPPNWQFLPLLSTTVGNVHNVLHFTVLHTATRRARSQQKVHQLCIYIYIYIHLRRGRTKASCFSDGGCTAEVGDRRGSCIQRRFGRRYRGRSMRRFWRSFGSRFQSRQGSRGGCGQRRGYWGLSLGLCH